MAAARTGKSVDVPSPNVELRITKIPRRKYGVWGSQWPKIGTHCHGRKLVGADEVAAAILLVAGFGSFHAEGLFLAVTDGAEAIGRDAQGN